MLTFNVLYSFDLQHQRHDFPIALVYAQWVADGATEKVFIQWARGVGESWRRYIDDECSGNVIKTVQCRW